jgi:putative spermidine/putrescine transport system ATP-binding protein
MVYVTHDQSEAMTMSDRIAVFSEGRIQQLDTAVGLYERPCNSFVAQFIGENNRLPGRVVERIGTRVRVAVEGGVVVEALAVNANDQHTMLSIRPERAMIEPPDDVGPNRFAARVEELIYLGDHRRVRLSFAGRDDFIVKVPSGHVHGTLEVGADVTVGWGWADCRALDA